MKIILSISTSTTFNLATEEFLFSKCQNDLLFLYVNQHSVIIGSNQAIKNEVNLKFCEENNIQIVRRMSGGGAVFHDLGNLNFCFISNKTEGKTSINDDFLLPIVNFLKNINIPVEIGKRKDLWLPGEFKISGTASHVSKNRELHHGTLLYDTDLEKLQKTLSVKEKDLTLKGISSVPSKVKNIKTYLTEQTGNIQEILEFKNSLINYLSEYYDTKVSLLSVSDISEIKNIELKKYVQNEWTYKK